MALLRGEPSSLDVPRGQASVSELCRQAEVSDAGYSPGWMGIVCIKPEPPWKALTEQPGQSVGTGSSRWCYGFLLMPQQETRAGYAPELGSPW